LLEPIDLVQQAGEALLRLAITAAGRAGQDWSSPPLPVLAGTAARFGFARSLRRRPTAALNCA
jgi:hypothetical protein